MEWYIKSDIPLSSVWQMVLFRCLNCLENKYNEYDIRRPEHHNELFVVRDPFTNMG